MLGRTFSFTSHTENNNFPGNTSGTISRRNDPLPPLIPAIFYNLLLSRIPNKNGDLSLSRRLISEFLFDAVQVFKTGGFNRSPTPPIKEFSYLRLAHCWQENLCYNHVAKFQMLLQRPIAADGCSGYAFGQSYDQRLTSRPLLESLSEPIVFSRNGENRENRKFLTFASRQARFKVPLIASFVIGLPLSRVKTRP